MSRAIVRIAVAAALCTGLGAVGVAALGVASPSTSAPVAAARDGIVSVTGYPSEGDYCYIEGMIPHHAQALELSELLLDSEGVRERTRALAEFILVDQQTEIEVMTEWRDAWMRALPADEGTGHGAHGGHGVDTAGIARGCGHDHDHDHAAMKGMATPEQLDALFAASGAAADELFLQLMIVHHEGALEMATTAVTSTSNAFIRSSGKHVLVEQDREVAAMTALLAELE